MKTKICPFCMKGTLKGYPFTAYSLKTEVALQPYDTSLGKACRKCCHCAEMEQALERKEYDTLTRFCLSYVNGRGEFKSLNIRFIGGEAVIFTSPAYKQTKMPVPYIIGHDETQTLKARLYGLHAEFWNKHYASGENTYVWWELELTFVDEKRIHSTGTDILPPQWNKLLKIVGVYYKWLLQDFSASKMYAKKYNHRTRKRELPTNTLPPFFDYWSNAKDIPAPERLPTPDDVEEGAKVCIYARSNGLGEQSSVKEQLKDCHAFCIAKRLTVVAEYTDEGETGLNEYGEELKRLIREASEKGFTHVIVGSVSRFSRDIGKAVKIRKYLAKCGLTAVILPPKKWGYWHFY